MKNICVFCSSVNNIEEIYKEKAEELGELLVRYNKKLIYGGGGCGLMGIIARSVLKNGGKVKGIIPHFLVKKESALHEIKPVIVDSMHERKKIMFEDSDAFIIMPGGVGTLEEFFEVLSWLQLDIHKKPIFLYNIKGYYNGLIDFLKFSTAENFINENLITNLYIEEDSKKVVNFLNL